MTPEEQRTPPKTNKTKRKSPARQPSNKKDKENEKAARRSLFSDTGIP